MIYYLLINRNIDNFAGKGTLCERVPRLPPSTESIITFQFHSLVVSLLDMERVLWCASPSFGT